MIGDAAGDAGIEVVDVRDGFEGHAVCDPAPMVNGLVLPVWESFHPTASGHAEYARLLASGRSSTARAADEVRVTFGPDTGASAARFWLPRLDSEESLAAADAAGLDREQVRALGFELRRWWSGGIDAPDLGLDEGPDGRRHRARWRPRRRSGPWVAEERTPRRVRMRGPDHPSG